MDGTVPWGGLSAGALVMGDLVLLIDRKGRRYMLKLDADKTFHSHHGVLPHRKLIGLRQGSRIRAAGGGDFLVVRPTLADYTLKMPRYPTIVYPKDVGAILVYGDIYPGATVLEAGIGSGALTLALLRAVGAQGRVISCEIRPEAAARAIENVRTFQPEMEEWLTVRLADVYEDIDDRGVDRVILDLPEPWRVVPHAAETLRDGGIFLCYVPTALQVHRVAEELAQSDAFGMVEHMEVILRPWDAGPTSVRPAHRMVAHTGFITIARRLAHRS